MNQNHIIAYDYLSQAQQALKAGDRKTAQEFCDQAKQIAPDLEEVWLLQASLATPSDSITYLEKALELNPGSERAKRGMIWAQNRLNQEVKTSTSFNLPSEPIVEVIPESVLPNEPIEELPGDEFYNPAWASPNTNATAAKKVTTRSWITVVSVLVLVALIALGWFYRDQVSSGINILLTGSAVGSTSADIDLSQDPTATIAVIKATATTIAPTTSKTTEMSTATPLPTYTSTSTTAPTQTSEPILTTALPLITVTSDPALQGLPSPTPLPTDTAEPTFEPYATATEIAFESPVDVNSNGERWIDVDLSKQMLYAYEGNTLVNSFVVSTGTWDHPTVTGEYHIYVKYDYTDMSGDDYYLADVPNTMYFYEGYAIHGTYWHNNFGTPMSHGCVNLSIPDSSWMFEFASVGTLVNVHY